MDKTGSHGKYWFSAAHVPDIVDMIAYQRQVYEYLKQHS